jgi:hypothetical protein
MKIYKLGNRYIADSDYSERDLLNRNGARFRWDPESGHWWTDEIERVRSLCLHPSVCFDKEVMKELAGVKPGGGIV